MCDCTGESPSYDVAPKQLAELRTRIASPTWIRAWQKTVKAKHDSTVLARRVIIWIYAGVFIGVALLSGVFFFQTYQEYAQLRRVEADTRQRLAQAEQRLQNQTRVLERLRNDPAFVEKVIRLQLRYAKPSELIFRFEE